MTLADVMATPPQLAIRWGVKVDKVYALIRNGELRAVNLALDKHGSRPRWKVPVTEVTRFEDSRANKPAEKKPRRSRRQVLGTKDYFSNNPAG